MSIVPKMKYANQLLFQATVLPLFHVQENGY
jgi:hypothetical protein